MTAPFLLCNPLIEFQNSCELLLLAITGSCPAAQITILFPFPFCAFLTGSI